MEAAKSIARTPKMGGKFFEFIVEFTSQVTKILNKAPDKISNRKYLISLDPLLSKIHDTLKKYPRIIIANNFEDAAEEESLTKKKFLFWLIHRTLWLKHQSFPEDLQENIHLNCDKNIGKCRKWQ